MLPPELDCPICDRAAGPYRYGTCSPACDGAIESRAISAAAFLLLRGFSTVNVMIVIAIIN